MRRPFLLVLYFFVFTLLSGSAYSQLITTLSLSLVQRYGANDTAVALVYLSLSLFSIVVTLGFGYLSDLYGRRWVFVLTGLLSGVLANYLAVGAKDISSFAIRFIPVFCFSYLCTPQLMSIFRECINEYKDELNIGFCNSIVRCGFAISWIAGPPVGYIVIGKFGIDNFFLMLSILYLVLFAYGIVGVLGVKDCKHSKAGVLSNIVSSRQKNRSYSMSIIILFASFSFAYVVNHGYLINLPLYVKSNAAELTAYIGLLFGLAAALEVPFMLISGWISKYVAIEKVTLVGMVCGSLLCFLTPFATSIIPLMAFQIFNGIFIGFVAGLGLLVFQNANVAKLGLMSSLYSITMTAGQIIASAVLLANSFFANSSIAFFGLGLFGVTSTFLMILYIRENYYGSVN